MADGNAGDGTPVAAPQAAVAGPPAAVIRQYMAPKLNPPDRFDFNDPGAWQRWVARWTRYREASGLINRPEREQITTFIYTLGEQAEDIILSRNIPENDYNQVLGAFNNYFGVRTNVITERAKFNRLAQDSDSMDAFINRLYRQAEYCGYGAL